MPPMPACPTPRARAVKRPGGNALGAAESFVNAPVRRGERGITPQRRRSGGAPQSATDTSGHKEAIEDGRTGILVPPANPRAMADAALGLLGDRERGSRLAAAAFKNAERRYDAGEIACSFEKLYRRLAD